MTKKIKVLLNVLFLFCFNVSLSYAQVESISNNEIKKIENLKNIDKDALISEDCFPCNVMELNLKDNLTKEEISKISENEGAVLQYLVFKDDLKESGIDTKQLSLNINSKIKEYKEFFKNNQEYKGGFVFLYTIVPIIDGDPHIKDLELQNKDLYNEIINKIECVSNQCASELVIEVSFTDLEQYPEMLLKLKDNKKSENPSDFKPAVINNLEHKKPINIYMLIGTNGFHVTPELKEELIKSIL